MDVVFTASLETGSTPLDIPDSDLASKLMLKTLAAPHIRSNASRKSSHKLTHQMPALPLQGHLASSHLTPAYFAHLLSPMHPIDLNTPPPTVTAYVHAYI